MVQMEIRGRFDTMQPMVQGRARNGQLGQQKLRYQEQGNRFPDHFFTPTLFGGGNLVQYIHLGSHYVPIHASNCLQVQFNFLTRFR